MSELRKRFAAEIKVARQAQGMTQEALTSATNTSVDFISKMERGLNSQSLETLGASVRALSLDAARILGAEQNDRLLSPARLELEAQVVQLVHDMDDSTLLVLIEIAHCVQKLAQGPSRRPSSKRK
jgi:transcriptional regulator with XRE-family HTH domain